jgi:hypothetical protein
MHTARSRSTGSSVFWRRGPTTPTYRSGSVGCIIHFSARKSVSIRTRRRARRRWRTTSTTPGLSRRLVASLHAPPPTAAWRSTVRSRLSACSDRRRDTATLQRVASTRLGVWVAPVAGYRPLRVGASGLEAVSRRRVRADLASGRRRPSAPRPPRVDGADHRGGDARAPRRCRRW